MKNSKNVSVPDLNSQNSSVYRINQNLSSYIDGIKFYNDYLYIYAYEISSIIFFVQTGHYRYISKLLLTLLANNIKSKKAKQKVKANI